MVSEAWVKEAWDQIAQVGPKPSRHVVDRLAALLGPEKVEWVGGLTDFTERALVSGRLLVFTKTVLAIVDLRDVGTTHSIESQHEGVTRIQLLARSRLLGIEMREDEHSEINSATAWSNKGEQWPQRARLHLVYEGLDEEIVVPESQTSASFGGFAHTLVADLAQA